MAFRGQYEHSLDSKDRLTIPARWRGQLADGTVLVAGLDPCVEVFSPRGYDDWTQRFLADLNRLGKKGRMMYRRFNASAQDEALDSAGRVRLAGHLIEHAGLDRPVHRGRGRRPRRGLGPAALAATTTPSSTSRPSELAEELAGGPGVG